MSRNVADWVADVAALTQPDRVHWCDGSASGVPALRGELAAAGSCRQLNQDTFPGCYLCALQPDRRRARRAPDVRLHPRSEDAGPNNNWMDAGGGARDACASCSRGCMNGRTLYVVPYCMGPIDSPYARCGVEITDSAYVVLNMALMTRMGRPALERIARDGTLREGPAFDRRARSRRAASSCISPRSSSIESFGSGYGGNALLGKKCHALRIASWQARTEGLARRAHADRRPARIPQGETHYIAAAFPSACGKTNLAMLIPPASLPGWKVCTVGDDIAWLHPGAGRPPVGDQSGDPATSASCRAPTRRPIATPTT